MSLPDHLQPFRLPVSPPGSSHAQEHFQSWLRHRVDLVPGAVSGTAVQSRRERR